MASIVRWSWNFGDGSTSTDPDPLHTYAASGTYTVTLAVVYSDGTTAEQSKIIDVMGVPPYVRKVYFLVGGMVSGQQDNVPADGSAAVVVTYDEPFSIRTDAVSPSILNDFQANPWALTVQYTDPTAEGFTVSVSGGPPGSTVSVGYIASGE